MESLRSASRSDIKQIAALPLGSRIKVDPWDDQIEMMHAKPVDLLSAREKMPFGLAPFYPHLERTNAESAVAATRRKLPSSRRIRQLC